MDCLSVVYIDGPPFHSRTDEIYFTNFYLVPIIAATLIQYVSSKFLFIMLSIRSSVSMVAVS